MLDDTKYIYILIWIFMVFVVWQWWTKEKGLFLSPLKCNHKMLFFSFFFSSSSSYLILQTCFSGCDSLWINFLKCEMLPKKSSHPEKCHSLCVRRGINIRSSFHIQNVIYIYKIIHKLVCEAHFSFISRSLGFIIYFHLPKFMCHEWYSSTC